MSEFLPLLAVGCGGACGAISRYLISLWVARHWAGNFPWATLFVNLSGCFLIGFAMELALTRSWFPANLRLVLVVGFLGSLTTFSTFGYETLNLLERGQVQSALAATALNLLLGLGAVSLGKALVPSLP